MYFFFFFQAEDGIRDFHVTGVQTCALPIFDPRVDEVNRVHVAVERLLLGGELEALLAEPLATGDSPRAGRQRASVPQAEFREPVPITHPIKTRILTGAYQIARGLQLT